MSLVRALKLKRAFTDSQRSFIAEKLLEGEYTPAEWIDFLEEIAEFDSLADKAREHTTLIMIFLGIGIFLSFFIIAFFPFLLLLLPVIVAMLIINIIIYFRLKRVDIPNRLRGFVLPLIAILKEEMKENEKIAIKADFRLKPDKNTQVGADKEIKEGSRKVTISYYHYPLLHLSAKLIDGSTLECNVGDNVRKNAIRKTNARGKTKWKTKYKIKTDYQVSLGLKKDAYAVKKTNAPIYSTAIRIQHTEKPSRNVFHVRLREYAHDPEHIPDTHKLLNLIAKAYGKVLPITQMELES